VLPPLPTCHDPPQPLHQLDGRSHGAPGFNPLVHEEDAQAWEGAEAAAECPLPRARCPRWQLPPPRWQHPAGSPGEMASVRTSITFSRPE